MLTALLGHLAGDHRVTAVFAQFPEVNDIAFHIGDLGEIAARRIGLASRHQLFSAPDGDRFVPSEKFRAVLDAFKERKRATFTPLWVALEQLVHETWHRPWRWLVFELHSHHERVLNALAFGDPWEGSFSVAPPPAPAPLPGESLEAYTPRIADFYRALTTQARGGIQANEDRHRRDVEWFYRHALKDPPDPIYTLAAEYVQIAAHLSGDQRATVKAGIARAERILNQLPVDRGPQK